MINPFDDLDSDEKIEYKPLEVELVKKMIPTYSSQKLCEMIVCDRYFGCFKDIAVACMEELSARRMTGNDFPFEKVIDEAYNTLPILNTKQVDLRSVLQAAIANKDK